MNAKGKNKAKRAKGIKGIGRHADMLGVRREHLWQVLTGRRPSRSLLSRYAQITKETP